MLASGLTVTGVQDRYDSQQEILASRIKYRELHIPLDNIVQDWFWWNTMGEMSSTELSRCQGHGGRPAQKQRPPMISVWPIFFRPGSPALR